MWEDKERFVTSASLEFAIPESPRDVFEARAVLKRFLTFCKYWFRCRQSQGPKWGRRGMREARKRGINVLVQRPVMASVPSRSMRASVARDRTGTMTWRERMK
jgi:hypothetical protein